MASGKASEDSWLGDFLGKPCFHLPRVRGTDATEGLQLFDSLRAEFGDSAFFADIKVPCGMTACQWDLEDAGFRSADVLLTFERSASPDLATRGTCTVRAARLTDETAVRSLAAKAFSVTRFHRDPLITAEVASRLKADWAGNFFHGRRGDAMVVAELDEKLVGFAQLFTGDVLVIDLIGVSEAARGRGVARDMVALAIAEHQPKTIRVGTQATNSVSCLVYESYGFRLAEAVQVMHYHNDREQRG